MLSTAYSCFCSLTINKLHQERKLRYREGNAQSSPWGHVNFTKVIFRPIKPVKTNRKFVPEEVETFTQYYMLTGENSTSAGAE